MLRGHCAGVLSRCCTKVISQAVTARKPSKCPVLRRQAGADLSCRGSIGSLQRVNGPTHGEPGCTIIFRCRPNPLLGRPPRRSCGIKIRNDRIGANGSLNQRCALTPDLESILRSEGQNILQHNQAIPDMARLAPLPIVDAIGPTSDIDRIEIPQRSSLLSYWGVLSFRSEAREVLIAVHTVQLSAADQAISLLRDLHQRQGADAAIDAGPRYA
jgi:hypothetical protein